MASLCHQKRLDLSSTKTSRKAPRSSQLRRGRAMQQRQINLCGPIPELANFNQFLIPKMLKSNYRTWRICQPKQLLIWLSNTLVTLKSSNSTIPMDPHHPNSQLEMVPASSWTPQFLTTQSIPQSLSLRAGKSKVMLDTVDSNPW